jgi:hypothetical protein
MHIVGEGGKKGKGERKKERKRVDVRGEFPYSSGEQ